MDKHGADEQDVKEALEEISENMHKLLLQLFMLREEAKQIAGVAIRLNSQLDKIRGKHR